MTSTSATSPWSWTFTSHRADPPITSTIPASKALRSTCGAGRASCSFPLLVVMGASCANGGSFQGDHATVAAAAEIARYSA